MDDIFGLNEATLHTRVRRLRDRYPGKITVAELCAVISASEGKCCWCSKDVRGSDLTIEHLEANNSPESLAVACFSCNSSHKVGHKTRSDVPPEVVELRALAKHKNWEKENRELYLALRRGEYQRLKEKIEEYKRLNREKILAGYKRYYDENQAKRVAYAREYTKSNKERIREQRKQWRADHPEEHASRFKEWYDANKERDRPRRQAYLEANREKVLEAKRAAYQANAEQRRAYAKAYAATHRDEINAKKREKRALAKAASA